MTVSRPKVQYHSTLSFLKVKWHIDFSFMSDTQRDKLRRKGLVKVFTIMFHCVRL